MAPVTAATVSPWTLIARGGGDGRGGVGVLERAPQRRAPASTWRAASHRCARPPGRRAGPSTRGRAGAWLARGRGRTEPTTWPMTSAGVADGSAAHQRGDDPGEGGRRRRRPARGVGDGGVDRRRLADRVRVVGADDADRRGAAQGGVAVRARGGVVPGGTAAPPLHGRDHSVGRVTASRAAGGRAARPAPRAPASRGRARPRTTSRTSASRHSPGRRRRAGRRRCRRPARARHRRCDPRSGVADRPDVDVVDQTTLPPTNRRPRSPSAAAIVTSCLHRPPSRFLSFRQ